MAKAWASSLTEVEHEIKIHSFLYILVKSYWSHISSNGRSIPILPLGSSLIRIDETVSAVAIEIGKAASKIDTSEASFIIGNIYTSLLPKTTRARNGVFYTPPVLTKRLIDLAGKSGVDWATAKILDPASGSGAFLVPVCLKMCKALEGESAAIKIAHIEQHLSGFEIDPFAAWLTQVFIEVALKDVLSKNLRIKKIVTVCDALEETSEHENQKYDLIIGNPPYGKIKLSESRRIRFRESLFGHVNYYGVFTHMAVELTRKKGIIAFLTPTSFLSGEYFKNLRSYLRNNVSPLEIDFVSFRKGVFEDVQQETMLAIYKKDTDHASVTEVNQITTLKDNELLITELGRYIPARDHLVPWILPRSLTQKKVVASMMLMTNRLKDWGYKISTGPLVWNRHKDQLHNDPKPSSFPVVWAESVNGNGSFELKAEKKNHASYFHFNKGDDWLINNRPCILLQRTTSKEQAKRLIAAFLSEDFLKKKKGVVIENHLNMILPCVDTPPISFKVLTVFLNSALANESFRAISGSVAVSAYELESFPLPSVSQMESLKLLLEREHSESEIEHEILRIYSSYE